MVIHDHLDCWLPPREADADEALRAHAEYHYDLVHGPLLRVQLLRTGDDTHRLLLGMHHIICDNTSWGVLLADLAAAYTGDDLPALPVQFADFVAWQRDRLTETVLDEQAEYWRDRLRDVPSVLDPPSGREGGTERTAHPLPADVVDAVRQLR